MSQQERDHVERALRLINSLPSGCDPSCELIDEGDESPEDAAFFFASLAARELVRALATGGRGEWTRCVSG